MQVGLWWFFPPHLVVIHGKTNVSKCVFQMLFLAFLKYIFFVDFLFLPFVLVLSVLCGSTGPSGSIPHGRILMNTFFFLLSLWYKFKMVNQTIPYCIVVLLLCGLAKWLVTGSPPFSFWPSQKPNVWCHHGSDPLLPLHNDIIRLLIPIKHFSGVLKSACATKDFFISTSFP